MDIQRVAAFFFVSVAAAMLSGCDSHLNEGAVTPSFIVTQNFGSASAVGHPLSSGGGQFFHPPTDALARQIENGHNYSINLISGFICDFRESGFLSSGDGTNAGAELCGENDREVGESAGTRGEIAIIANVIERDGTNEGSRVYDDFVRSGRVVFYSEDVRESGQVLNFRNIPLAGPIKYNGGSVFAKISIVEFNDQENEQTKALFTKLEELGTASGFFPASPVLQVLNDLGGAVLSENKDDVEFLFQFQLDPAAESDARTGDRTTTFRAPLMEGYIVLLRQENRSEDVDFGSQAQPQLYLCVRQGVISEDPDCLVTYREQTWMIVRVSKEAATAAQANNSGQSYEEFRQRTEALGQINAGVNSQVTEQLFDASAEVLKQQIAP